MCEKLQLGGECFALSEGPIAIHTRIRWVLSGQLNCGKRNKSSLSMMVLRNVISEQEVQRLWLLEIIGIHDPAETQTRKEIEESAVNHFNENVKQDDTLGRYTVSLPWTEGHPELPDNKKVAFKRLQSTTEKLRESGHLQLYDQVFQQWLAEGIIQTVGPSADSSTKVHYLPHRAVYKENSTTPIRPVFDASSKVKDRVSLNDCLEKGPNLLELIPAILTRFRMDTVGAVADIRKAFLQMKVDDNDRDF